jgi:lysozyme
VGLSDDEIDYLLANDMARVKIELGQILPWTSHLDDARLGALRNMAFNLGIPRLLGFKKMLAAFEAGNWQEAANQMADSLWAEQAGDRAVRLQKQVLTGTWQ